ncbi:hypothetical protein C0993_008089 [Termitomyces sp. T159_Od127]|nr:hypothetical protein C0993_008089 [Termitomyces sp. T159_Od127]
MVSRKLIGVWAALDLFLLAAGVVAVALSIVWRAENTLLNLVLTPNYLTVGLALGIALLVTFALSVGAITQKNHVTIGLVILNYTLLVDAIGIVIIGTYIWFFTLQERNNFFVRWAAASSDFRIKLQDQRRAQLKANKDSEESVKSLAVIEDRISQLGGLETYQRMSAIGQGTDRGGGSEKILIGWLKDFGFHKESSCKLR